MTAPLYLNKDGYLVNMYDCTPCPKCKDTHRFPYPKGNPECCCEECGFKEPWIRSNGRPAEEEL